MAHKYPQAAEILAAIGENGIDPQQLIDALLGAGHPKTAIIEGLQCAIERGKISLASDGMVVAVKREFARLTQPA